MEARSSRSHKVVDVIRQRSATRRRDHAFAGAWPHSARDAELEHLLRARIPELPPSSMSSTGFATRKGGVNGRSRTGWASAGRAYAGWTTAAGSTSAAAPRTDHPGGGPGRFDPAGRAGEPRLSPAFSKTP
jgi:hypothetical protein